jgi:hypothetical protein
MLRGDICLGIVNIVGARIFLQGKWHHFTRILLLPRFAAVQRLTKIVASLTSPLVNPVGDDKKTVGQEKPKP